MFDESPFVLVRASVDAVERVSHSFARITFGGVGLDAMGTPGRVFDQRIKLILPGPSGRLAELTGAGMDWYPQWQALPEEVRGALRTYSIRQLIVDGTETKVVVDFVLHLDPRGGGPASLWASAAQRGDEVFMFGPRRGRSGAGGIEYSPGSARSITLVGDETAAPAIARILEDVDRDVQGVAFIEVPEHDDVLPIRAPNGVQVHWLPRGGQAHGAILLPTVLDYLGAHEAPNGQETVTDELLWETPTYSGLAEETTEAENRADRYVWIAGESSVVTTLRRHLVRDLSIDRAQVAFMGYWKKTIQNRAVSRVGLADRNRRR